MYIIRFTFSFLQGHAIINISIGCGPQSWVVATCTLQCKGNNDGAEHTELAAEVNNVLGDVGIKPDNEVAYVSDSAAVLKAAYTHVLPGLYPESVHITCMSHGLNNVGKVILSSILELVTEIFERGPGQLHAKRHAASGRMWFASLKAKQRGQ